MAINASLANRLAHGPKEAYVSKRRLLHEQTPYLCVLTTIDSYGLPMVEEDCSLLKALQKATALAARTLTLYR